MTIHELASMSGVSVRSLHHYDKIGLLKPSYVADNGYRQYDEDSLKRLSQILFYKEMDIPLKEIASILKDPTYDPRNAVVMQHDVLVAKRDRLSRLIHQMEQIMNGKDCVDFSMFEHNELEEVFRKRLSLLNRIQKQELIDQYGSLENFLAKMMQGEDRVRASAIKQYGSMPAYYKALDEIPPVSEEVSLISQQIQNIIREIASHRGEDISSPCLLALAASYKSLLIKLAPEEDMDAMFERFYVTYTENEEVIKVMNKLYGENNIQYVGQVMRYYAEHLTETEN